MLRAARCGRMLAAIHNIIPMSASQPSTGLSFSDLPATTAEALRSAAAFICKGIERQEQGSEAFAGFEAEGACLHDLSCGRRRLKRGTTKKVRFTGRVRSSTGLRRRQKPRCSVRSRIAVLGTAPETHARRRKPGSGRRLPHGSRRLPRPPDHGPLHAERRGQTLRKAGGHEPVVEPPATSSGDGGRSLEGEGRSGLGRNPRGETGAVRFPSLSRSTGLRFVPTSTKKRAGAKRPAVSFHDADGDRLETLYFGRKLARRR